jgi:hypothetical protein
MRNAKPIFDQATHYRIEVRGRVDVEWLRSFDSSLEIFVGEIKQDEDLTVLGVRTDQAGIVGLVRRMHALGMTILQILIVSGDDHQKNIPHPGSNIRKIGHDQYQEGS